MLECLGDTDFLAKLHCIRQACQVKDFCLMSWLGGGIAFFLIHRVKLTVCVNGVALDRLSCCC